MPKITYLLGAGASALKIPVVNNFSEELGNYGRSYENYDLSADIPGINKEVALVTKRYSDRVISLANECATHSSIDTYARKLFLRNTEESKRELMYLKFIVSEFIHHQQINKGIDPRYDAFFAALLDKDSNEQLTTPKDINILSWNYDKQIEYSIAQFASYSESNGIEDIANIHPRLNFENQNRPGFGVYKLNGTVGGKIIQNTTYKPVKLDYSLTIKGHPKKKHSEYMFSKFQKFLELEEYMDIILSDPEHVNTEFVTISYSWEKKPFYNLMRQKALEALENTEILVIIGYSFPVFNRSIDYQISNALNNLKKVYIQDLPESIDGVIQRYDSIFRRHNIKPNPITNVKEFYIPFEYGF